MADVTKNVKVKADFEDNTKAGVSSLTKNVKDLGKETSTLDNEFANLSKSFVGLFAASELLSFFAEAGKLAEEDEMAIIRLNGALKSLGMTVGGNKEIKEFEDYMVILGQTVSDTDKSLTKFTQVTGDLKSSMALSKLATDLAASGYGDLQSNTEALANIFQGKMRQAAMAFNIDMRDNATAAEILAEIQGKVSVSSEEMAESTHGSLQSMRTDWDELKSKAGTVSNFFLNTVASSLLHTGKYLKDIFTGDFENALDDLSLSGKKVDEESKKSVEKLKETGLKSAAEIAQSREDAAKATAEQKKLSDSLEASFRDVSKAVVSAVSDQEKAIDNLRKANKELDDQLSSNINNANDKYKQDVANIARSAKTKIDEINKQILEEGRSQNSGFRTRISELEAQKAKEQAILDKAGGVVTDISKEISKDDFDLLQEKHQKELGEIAIANDKKKKLNEEEIKARTEKIGEISTMVGGQDFYSRASKEGNTFAGSIGSGGIQQVIQFTFNGDVSDIETLKKQVVDSLNRTAQLRQIGAKN